MSCKHCGAPCVGPYCKGCGRDRHRDDEIPSELVDDEEEDDDGD